MKLVEEAIEKSKMKSESLDFYDTCDVELPFSSSEPILSPLQSSSDEKQSSDIDNEDSYGELSTMPGDNNEIKGKGLPESETSEKNDGKGIFHGVKNFENVKDEENENLTGKYRSDWMQAVPESLRYLETGWVRPGDCGRPAHQKPDWLDMDKFRRGQKFAQDHALSVYYSELIALLAVLSFEDGIKPLIITGSSSTPYAAFRRYLSAALRFRHWYTQDPWTRGTTAQRDIAVVRAMHSATRRKLDASTIAEIDAAAEIPNALCTAREMLLEDFTEACEAPAIGQCPHIMLKNHPGRSKGISQTEMAVTQWSFIGLITTYPKSFGVYYATDEDLEAFCHMWRTLGYQLGIEDEYNICGGTLEDVRKRSRDILHAWIKPNFRQITPEVEHMGRCFVTGMSVVFPFVTYETALLRLTEIMELKMPRLYASLSYKDWINYNIMRTLMNYAIKVPGVSGLANAFVRLALNRAEKFTPLEFEAIRVKLSSYTGNNTRIKGNSVSEDS